MPKSVKSTLLSVHGSGSSSSSEDDDDEGKEDRVSRAELEEALVAAQVRL